MQTVTSELYGVKILCYVFFVVMAIQLYVFDKLYIGQCIESFTHCTINCTVVNDSSKNMTKNIS